MNVLLVTSAAPEKSPFSTSEKRPPLGVGSLISTARARGHKVFFIDNYLAPSNFIADGFLQKNAIELVGISVNTICFRHARHMFEALHDLRIQGRWRGKIAVGGPHTSVAPYTIPEFVDFVVQGEGEEALSDILAGRAGERVIRQCKVKDMDSLPFQPWDIFTRLPYDFTCPWIELKPVYTMNTSRGCPFNCSFCSVGSIWGRQYTIFSAERIAAEIEYLMKHHNARGIYFREDNFTLNPRRTFEFCDTLLKRNIKISWACETRVDNLSEDMIALMARAGCEAFYLGIESGSQRMLDFLNKSIRLEQVEKVIAWSKRHGIKTYCSLVAGIPGETYRDYRATVRLMKRAQPYDYAFNVYVGLADSPLYQHIRDNRLHEYEDDIGLLYLPGFDARVRFFYNQDSEKMVDWHFKKTKRSFYDWLLLVHHYTRKLKNFILRRLKK